MFCFPLVHDVNVRRAVEGACKIRNVSRQEGVKIRAGTLDSAPSLRAIYTRTENPDTVFRRFTLGFRHRLI
jgi:hypothetical protein